MDGSYGRQSQDEPSTTVRYVNDGAELAVTLQNRFFLVQTKMSWRRRQPFGITVHSFPVLRRATTNDCGSGSDT